MKPKQFFEADAEYYLLCPGNMVLSGLYYVNILQPIRRGILTVINNANSGNVEKYAFGEVVCNFRKNMNETVDNYVPKKILDSSNYWNLNDSKKMVIHRVRWIKLYTISKK